MYNLQQFCVAVVTGHANLSAHPSLCHIWGPKSKKAQKNPNLCKRSPGYKWSACQFSAH